jgi:hypothetical protein
MEKSFAYIASWVSWLADFCRPPGRIVRESVLLALLLETMELKVSYLKFQVQQLFSLA